MPRPDFPHDEARTAWVAGDAAAAAAIQRYGVAPDDAAMPAVNALYDAGLTNRVARAFEGWYAQGWDDRYEDALALAAPDTEGNQ